MTNRCTWFELSSVSEQNLHSNYSLDIWVCMKCEALIHAMKLTIHSNSVFLRPIRLLCHPLLWTKAFNLVIKPMIFMWLSFPWRNTCIGCEMSDPFESLSTYNYSYILSFWISWYSIHIWSNMRDILQSNCIKDYLYVKLFPKLVHASSSGAKDMIFLNEILFENVQRSCQSLFSIVLLSFARK